MPKGSIKRRLVSGGFWTLSNRLLVTLTQLAALALLARLLSPEDMGVYFLIANLVAVLTVISQLGLTQTVVRLIADALARNQLGRARIAIRDVLILGTLSAAVTGIILQFGLGQWLAHTVFHSDRMAAMTLWVALWAMAQTVQRFLDEMFRGLHDLRLVAIFSGLVTGILTVGFYAVLYWTRGEADLRNVLILNVLAFGISVVMAGVVLSLKIRPLRGEGEIAVREIVAISWPLFLASITNIILVRADLWILGMYVPEHEVAVYGAAARIIALVTIPLTMAGAILAPMIVELHAQDQKERLEKVLRAVATLGGLPAVVIIVLFVFVGQPGLELIYGDALYREGWLVLVLLGLGQLANVWSGVCGQLLMMTGHQMAIMLITLASSALAILGALLAVQPFGMYGVACAFAVAIALQNIGMAAYGHSKLGVRSSMLLNPLALRGLLAELRGAIQQRRQSRLQVQKGD
jgi:O-antigen/teichoic acid export membrane protein